MHVFFSLTTTLLPLFSVSEGADDDDDDLLLISTCFVDLSPKRHSTQNKTVADVMTV